MHVLSDEQKLGEAGSARAGSITVSGDRPLHGLAKFAVISSAALAILLFYLYVIGAVLVLITCLALELFLFVVLLRLGMSRMVTPYLERHSRLLLHFARSAWLPGTHTEFQVPLEEGDAPRLFAFLRKLAQRLKVPAPRQVLIEMSSGAWVKLKGVRQGANATTLGLGYDLLAGLSERELEAVLAHEMAHAKFVRRGLKRLLNGGVGRAARLANGLSAMVDAYRRAHESFALAEWLLAGADRTARLAVRLVAAYSRQDEFEADRGAAEICGAGPLRTSLLKLEQMAKKTARISWNERVARLQRGEGFSDWLMGELQVGISAETGASEVFDLYSTHPSIRDRVAALPEDSVPRPEGASAIQVLENPDQIATRLVAEIHRVGSLEEKRDSRERLRWLKRVQRGGATRGTQWLGALILVTGIIVGAFAWVDRFSPPTLLVAFGLIAGGVALCRYRGPRDRWNLPVPGYEALKRAQRSPDDPSTRDARQAAIKAELEQTMAGLSKREKLARLRAEAGIALERCDYLRAYAATRRRDELDKPDPESLMIGAVASAGLQLHSQAGNLLEGVVKDARLRSPGSCWGAAWTLFLLGD